MYLRCQSLLYVIYKLPEENVNNFTDPQLSPCVIFIDLMVISML